MGCKLLLEHPSLKHGRLTAHRLFPLLNHHVMTAVILNVNSRFLGARNQQVNESWQLDACTARQAKMLESRQDVKGAKLALNILGNSITGARRLHRPNAVRKHINSRR
jgi:hypothetical protein